MTNVTDFNLTSNYGLAIQQTFVSICYDDEYLHLRPNGKVSVNYLEVELFVSIVNNPNDACSGVQGSLVGCSASGIVYGASTTPIGWEGSYKFHFN